MTPAQMAEIHAACFITPRPWSAAEIADLLASTLCFFIAVPSGFLMGRVVAGEAELLTLAVMPVARQRGIGGQLMAGFLTECRARGADSVFLEVAENNPAALHLYARMGFAQTGRRPAYYHPPQGPAVAALILAHEFG